MFLFTYKFLSKQVIDGELVYRINSKTIKKINVTLGPPVKPLPTEKRETTDSTPNPVPTSEASTVQEVEELSDTEAAEKENIEHFDDNSQKAEVARVRVANKVIEEEAVFTISEFRALLFKTNEFVSYLEVKFLAHLSTKCSW